jgi:rhomboid protease GluP
VCRAELIDPQTAVFWYKLFELTPTMYVTRALVGINVAVFVVMVASGVSLTNPTTEALWRWGANFGPKTLAGEWWRLLTCTFLHIGVIHLAFNMWVLTVSGRFVERMFGHVGFLLLYLISGLGGSLTSLIWHPDVTSAGASGAIFGIYGGLLGVVWRQSASIPAPALAGLKKSGIMFLVLNLVIGLSLPNIDLGAHLGGLVTGFFCGLVLSVPFTPEGAAQRPARNALTAVLGIVLVAGGVLLASAVLTDWANVERELERFGETERRLLDTYSAAQQRAAAGEITDAALTDVVERDVLPQWRDATARLAPYAQLSGPVGRRVTAWIDYMRLREEAWELFVRARREVDPAKAEQARQKFRRADETRQQLMSGR